MLRLVRALISRFSLVLGVVLVVYSAWFAFAVYIPRDAAAMSVRIAVKPGDGISEIAQTLVKKGVIRDALAFQFYAAVSGLAGRIQAGEYTVSGAQAVPSLVHALSIPVGPEERSITTIEGWTIQDIALYLEKEGIVSRDEFLGALRVVGREKYLFLPKDSGDSLEGYLFPDTYRIFDKASAGDVITKMLDNFNDKFSPDMVRSAKESGRSIHQIITLASIVEGEVQTDEDRAMVADIFLRRIEQGMRLQSDATVNYVTGKKKAQASYDDLEVDSRYNTYRYNGLPPGPIGNPGLSSIEAALRPKKNPYLFFLTTRENEVIYSKTYDEHLVNKRKYLDIPNEAAKKEGAVVE